ncbi:hypothetical protein QTP88_013284 [Uroleucon formosanum]
MFTDDLNVFCKVESEVDCVTLQNELDSINLWFSTHGLHFNINKCKFMSFARCRVAIDYLYTINDTVIDRATSNNDLGVLFTADINFCPHIDSICCRALKSLGFIMRMMNEFKLVGSLKTVYCSFVRSLLEYVSVLWDPFVVIDSCHVERVQRRFLSSAAYMLKIVHPSHDYTTVLHALNLTSLADRRVKANVDFLEKLIDGSINGPSLLEKVNFKVPHRTTRSRVPFAIPFHSTNYGRNNPIDRMMRLGKLNILTMALNEKQILDLLNDGYNSDVDVLDENDDCDDELEILLRNFENDDLIGYLEALREEEDQLQANEVEHEDIDDETHEITAPIHTPGTSGLNFVQKKDIEWINMPCTAPILELDDLVIVDPPIDMPTPIEYFMKYFNNTFFENVAFNTNVYAVQNNSSNFKPTSATEIKSLIAIQMIMGCLKYPKKEMYWTRRYRVNIIADTMTKNRFFSLRQHIHLVNNLDIPKNNKDKFVKVRPIYDTLNIRCQQLPVERNLSVDEQIVPFKSKLK